MHVLGRVQDRLMSLESIDKPLYSETQVGSVRANILLTEITQSSVIVGTESIDALDLASLDPDQRCCCRFW